MSVDNIVSVVIERGTKTVSRTGFGTPLILGSNCDSFGADKIRAYTSLDAVATDFASTDAEYKAAQAIFSQTIRPSVIKIGAVGVAYKKKVQVSVADVQNSTVYSLSINDKEATFTSDADATDVEIIAGMEAAITALSEPVTLTNNSTTLDIEANVAGIDFKITPKLDGLLNVVSTSTYTTDVSDALAAIRLEDDDFYFVLSTSRTKSDLKDIAAYVETTTKLFGYTTFDTDVTTTATDDVVSELQTLNYDRTFGAYTVNSDNYLSEAIVGLMSPKDPGSATWKFKNLSGVVSDELNTTISNRIKNKSANVYTVVSSFAIFEEGVVASGEFIDIIRGTDWIQVNIQADVYTALVNNDKIDYTNAGIDTIKSPVVAVLNLAVTIGILTNDPSPTVTAPDVSAISSANKTARLLPDVEFTGTYAGAVHKVEIQGKLTI
jgi:hypothetical protein